MEGQGLAALSFLALLQIVDVGAGVKVAHIVDCFCDQSLSNIRRKWGNMIEFMPLIN